MVISSGERLELRSECPQSRQWHAMFFGHAEGMNYTRAMLYFLCVAAGTTRAKSDCRVATRCVLSVRRLRRGTGRVVASTLLQLAVLNAAGRTQPPWTIGIQARRAWLV